MFDTKFAMEVFRADWAERFPYGATFSPATIATGDH